VRHTRFPTWCRTPVPPLPARAGCRYYLRVAEYADLLNSSEQVRKVTNAHECNNVKRCHTAKPTAKKPLYAWRTNRETATGQTRREEIQAAKFDSPRRITEPRNIPYIDGFDILKLPEDPGILRNSSELFENSRNFTRFLF